MSSLQLENICKSFGEHDVVRDANLDVTSGEFVVFVGPSGCGKSTLLRMISGLEEITSGTLRIGDKVVNDVSAADRGIAMVFQSYALYPHMSVRQNLSFGLRMTGSSRADTAQRVNRAMEILQISHLADRRPKALSGGQRQRVAIGRAIVREPEIFLFDEPLSNLDAELRVQMRVEIAKLHHELGTTMIYVTHDQTEAMTMADRIVVLRDGRIEQIGTPLELFDNPVNRFVAAFVGSPRMNFLTGTIEAIADGKATVLLDEHDGATVIVPVSDAAKAGQNVEVGVRPEHFAWEPAGEGALSLRVDVVEHLGTTNFAYANVGEANELIVQRGEEGRFLKAGDVVRLGVPSDRALLFDTDGRRLR